MKKLLPLLVCAPMFAATVTNVCDPNPATYLGQTNGGTAVCEGFALPGGAVIDSITAEYIFDFQFDGFNNGVKEVTFQFDAPGGSGDFGGTATVFTRPFLSPVLTIAPADWAAFVNGFNLSEAFTGASTAITGATFTKRFTLTYSDASEVPEPATYAMLGLGLVAFALGKRR